MINTAAFDSLMRYEKLEAAIQATKKSTHPYHWMHYSLIQAAIREVRFMLENAARWEKELPLPEAGMYPPFPTEEEV